MLKLTTLDAFTCFGFVFLVPQTAFLMTKKKIKQVRFLDWLTFT